MHPGMNSRKGLLRLARKCKKTGVFFSSTSTPEGLNAPAPPLTDNLYKIKMIWPETVREGQLPQDPECQDSSIQLTMHGTPTSSICARHQKNPLSQHTPGLTTSQQDPLPNVSGGGSRFRSSLLSTSLKENHIKTVCVSDIHCCPHCLNASGSWYTEGSMLAAPRKRRTCIPTGVQVLPWITSGLMPDPPQTAYIHRPT